MPKELDLDVLETELDTNFSPEQREWIARLLHDHVSGLVTALAMQVEIVKKMLERDMDLTDEVASLKDNMRNAAEHIKGIESTIRPKQPDTD